MASLKKAFRSGGIGGILGAAAGIALGIMSGGTGFALLAPALIGGGMGAASGGMQGYEAQKQEDLAKETQEKELIAASAQTPAYQAQDTVYKTAVQKRRGLASTILTKGQSSQSSGKTTTA